MFGTYFYNESMRRMTIAFGQLFNNIQIIDVFKNFLFIGTKKTFIKGIINIY